MKVFGLTLFLLGTILALFVAMAVLLFISSSGVAIVYTPVESPLGASDIEPLGEIHHTGDLIVDDNETYVIEDATFFYRWEHNSQG